MEHRTAFVIIKEVINSKGRTNPVILVNNISEIMEFDTVEEATAMAALFENNSDSGWKYKVREI